MIFYFSVQKYVPVLSLSCQRRINVKILNNSFYSMKENQLIYCRLNTHYITKIERINVVKKFFQIYAYIIFYELGWFQKFKKKFEYSGVFWVPFKWNFGETSVRYNFNLNAWVEKRDDTNFFVSSSSWRNLKLSDDSYEYELLPPKSSYPVMNNHLVVSIQNNQLNVFAVDSLRVTAAAWCLNEMGMVISDDGFLIFEEAKVFCQSRNSKLWIPKSNNFLEDPKFFIEFVSRLVMS